MEWIQPKEFSNPPGAAIFNADSSGVFDQNGFVVHFVAQTIATVQHAS
jgi:hypothetical protein